MSKKRKQNNSPKQEPNLAKPQEVSEIFFFDKLGDKGILIATLLISLIAFFVFKDFLLYNKVYLFKDIGSDTLNFNLPFLYSASRYFEEYGTLSWSFSNGMGQSLFPLFLRDPFDLIIILGGTENIHYLLIIKEVLKIVLGGVIFYLFLSLLSINNFTKTIGATLFSFCAFMIVGGGWYLFSFEALNCVLLLLGFELLYQKNKGWVFSFAVLLLVASMPFNLYTNGLLIAIYAIVRVLSKEESTYKDLISTFGKMILWGTIGICLAGPLLLENINQLLESPRGSGDSSYFQQLASMPMFEISSATELGTSILRFFSSDIIGTGNKFKGWGNTLEAPMFYCGILSLLLIPQLFLFLSKRQKIVIGILLFITCFPIVFPYFRRAFWLFSGDYYRTYSFFVSLLFLTLSIISLDFIIKNKKINLIVLGVTVITLFGLLTYPYFENHSPVISKVSIIVKGLLVFYPLTIFLFTKSKQPLLPMTILLLLVSFELYYMSDMSVNKRETLKVSELQSKTGYNDYTIEVIDFIKKNDDSFYRIDKNYSSTPAMHGSLNDGLIQNYYGTSCYNGFAQKGYIDYLKNYGVVGTTSEIQTRWVHGLRNRIILQSLNSVKYYITKSQYSAPYYNTYDKIGQFEDIIVLKNKYSLPLGFNYNQYIKQSDFSKLSTFQKDLVSLSAIAINDSDVHSISGIKEYDLTDTISQQNFSYEKYDSLITLRRIDTLSITSFTDHHIVGTITTKSKQMMYFSIPYDKGWIITVNENSTQPILAANGMMTITLEKGHNNISLEFKHQFVNKGILLSIIGLIGLLGMIIMNRKKEEVIEES